MNKNNITHPENMNTEDTKKEMIPSAFPPKENGEHSNRKSLSIAFIIVLVAVLLFTAIGMILMRKQPHIPGARRRLGETGRYSCGNKQPYDRSQIPPSRRFGAGSSATKQKDRRRNPPTDHCHGTATLE